MGKLIVRVGVSALLFTVITEVIWSLSSYIFMPLYLDAQYIATWSRLALPGSGSPVNMMLIMGAITLVFSVAYVLFYRCLRDKLSGGVVKKGLYFAGMIYILGALPGYLMSLVMINLSVEMYLSWMATSLAVFALGGLTVARINKI